MTQGGGRPVARGVRQAVDAVAVLDDELRLRLYEYVRDCPAPVSRDEVAAHAGISPRLAAFHLDKLVHKGLLAAYYARKPGRSGPGAGRSSKFYRPAETEFDISIPQRRYDLVSRILVDAIEGSDDSDDSDDAASASLLAATERVAREHGERLGTEARQETGSHPRGTLRAAGDALAHSGFEPHWGPDGTLTLRNCPFDALAQTNPQLVCAINQALIDGLLRGLGASGVETSLEPALGRCCVTLTYTGSPASG